MTIVENTWLNLTCQVPYTAQWSPLVSWSGLRAEDDLGVVNDSEHGLSWAVVHTGPLDYSYNGEMVECKVNFTEPPPGAIEDGEEYDQSAPDYEDFCQVILDIKCNNYQCIPINFHSLKVIL